MELFCPSVLKLIIPCMCKWRVGMSVCTTCCYVCVDASAKVCVDACLRVLHILWSASLDLSSILVKCFNYVGQFYFVSDPIRDQCTLRQCAARLDAQSCIMQMCKINCAVDPTSDTAGYTIAP